MKHPHPTTGVWLTMFFIMTFFCSASALSDGYVLTAAYGGTTTALIDSTGSIVKEWNHATLTNRLNGYSCYLLPNGNLLRSAQTNTFRLPMNANPTQGAIDEVDKDGKVVWTYTLANDSLMLHHDMKPILSGKDSGNILAVTFYSIPKTRVKTFGIDTTLLTTGMNTFLGEKIIEIKPKLPSGGDIIWEWSIFDHITPKDSASFHPERISGGIVPTLWQGQWVHLNGIDYCPETKLIVFTSRIFNELFVLDHSTTTQEAKGHTGGTHGKGGDILYRWGKPGNYGAGGGITLDCLHSPTWIPEGHDRACNIMFFHNNMNVAKSEVIEIKPPYDNNGKFICETGKTFGPVEPAWKYAPTSGFYSKVMSTAIRMPNGNTMIHESYPTDTFWQDGARPQTDSRLREVNAQGQILWIDTLTLKGMTGFNPAKIMWYTSTYVGVRKLLNLPPVAIRSNHTGNRLHLSQIHIRRTAGSIVFSGVDGCTIDFVSVQGKTILSMSPHSAVARIKTDRMPAGIYYAKVTKGGREATVRMITILK